MNKIYITKNKIIVGELNKEDLGMNNATIYECLKELVRIGLFKKCGKYNKKNYYVELNDDE